MNHNATKDGFAARSVFGAALLFTVAFFFFVFWLMMGETCDIELFFIENCQSKWQYFLSAKPNEVGDALAGIASGLALIWIVASVVIQRLELFSTVNELRKATEIERQRDALREYPLALREFSNAFFSGERAELMYGEWSYRPPGQDNIEHVVIRTTIERKTGDDENDLGIACAMIAANVSKIFENKEQLTSRPKLKLEHKQLLLSLLKIRELKERLPTRESNNLNAMKLSEAIELLERLLNEKELFDMAMENP